MQYWVLQNADGKKWIIPTREVSTALGIYQPSNWRGKMLKRTLPLFGGIKKFFSPFTLVENPLDGDITRHIETIFPGHNLEYSLFLGTPSVHQKTVIQIFEGHNILGYAKVTEREGVCQLFDHEEKILRQLDQKGIRNVPRCLFNQKIEGNRQLFVMTTEKDKRSVVMHSWSRWHEDFISMLEDKTCNKMLFDDSDYAKLLNALCLRKDSIPTEMQNTIMAEINNTREKYHGMECDMTVMHGDFTPWNMFRQDDLLFVFDWEYAMGSCPMGLDKWHFLIQSAIFEKHLDAEQIVDSITSGEMGQTNKDTLIMYLLAIIAIYVCREEKSMVCANIGIYVEILEQLNEK